MLTCVRLGSLLVALSAAVAWGQKPKESADGGPTISPRHDIPIDAFGNVVRIVGRCNSRAEAKPNGAFEIRFPPREARSVLVTTVKVAIRGATIDRSGVQSSRMVKSTTDYVKINDANNAVDIKTHSQDGALKLPLVAEKDAQVTVLVYLETANGSAGFRYFLNPRGLSSEPVKKEERKKDGKKK
jgi:hypothetical protein